MNEALIITLYPTYAMDVLNRNKLLELRKGLPRKIFDKNGKLIKGMWCYIVVKKGKEKLYYSEGGYADNIGSIEGGYYLFESWMDEEYNEDKLVNGNVVARFWFDEYDKYVDATNCYMTSCGMQCDNEYMYQLCELQDELKNTCLTCDEIEAYGKGKDLYAWHIKNLEIFDYPMELSDFYTWNKGDKWTPDMNWLILKRAPQSWQYVYVKERLDDTI